MAREVWLLDSRRSDATRESMYEERVSPVRKKLVIVRTTTATEWWMKASFLARTSAGPVSRFVVTELLRSVPHQSQKKKSVMKSITTVTEKSTKDSSTVAGVAGILLMIFVMASITIVMETQTKIFSSYARQHVRMDLDSV
jgi:hypothetical protein